MVKIKGIQKISMIDYPDKICSIIFTPGCNFRCPFCYNKDLVLNHEGLPEIPEDEILEFLNERKKWIDGVCITGGEPLLSEDIQELIKKIKDLGLLVKLDTNGTNPGLLKKLISGKLVDYVAMDVKNSFEKYDKTTESKIDIDKIKGSIKIIKGSKVDNEFRITVLRRFHTLKDIENISKNLSGAKKIYIQNFKRTPEVIDESLTEDESFEKEELEDFKKILEKNVTKVEIRNV